jgi:hypothetical protein
MMSDEPQRVWTFADPLIKPEVRRVNLIGAAWAGSILRQIFWPLFGIDCFE